ncbi:MAG: ATP-dependent helicase, partial [Paracoccaceae bacterium]|nr:ATP-dependent helicase [Paracoccaceae bacterium]
LVKALEEFENIQSFLEHISLMMENDTEEGSEKISIMTLHASKGLEFTTVFLPGWEDGLFPSQRSLDEMGTKGLEEERRLAYVGITRSEEHCTISFASNRRIYNQWQSAIPSRFIDDLSKHDVEVITSPALYGGNFGVATPIFGSREDNQLDPNSTRPGEESNILKKINYNSPGWQRMKAQLQSNNSPRHTKFGSPQIMDHNLEVGERVFHQKFGYGQITSIDLDTTNVTFEKSGDKKVKSNYLLSKDKMP